MKNPLLPDLAGFTASSERSDEEAAYALIHRITKLLRSAIRSAHGGSVGSFTGDGVMALFGAPRALKDARGPYGRTFGTARRNAWVLFRAYARSLLK
jgi:class 3 adenylate cyclase